MVSLQKTYKDKHFTPHPFSKRATPAGAYNNGVEAFKKGWARVSPYVNADSDRAWLEGYDSLHLTTAGYPYNDKHAARKAKAWVGINRNLDPFYGAMNNRLTQR